MRLLFRAYRSIVVKELVRFMRIWPQTMMPPAISISLYFLIFGKMMGERIGPMQGIAYIDYIAPGLIMMYIISNSYGNVVSSFYGAKFQRFIEEMLVAPIPTWILLAGYMTGGIMRGVLTGIVVTSIALFFTDLRVHSIFLIMLIVFLTAALFSLGGLINGIFARKFDDVSIIPIFIITPLIYLGGVFYSTKLLPEFWQKVSALNPMLYIVNVFRYGLLGVSDVQIGTALLIVSAATVLLFLISHWLLKKGIGIKN